MSRTLEDMRTENRGIKTNVVGKTAILVFAIACYPMQVLLGQYYYINTYENPRGPSSEQLTADIFVKSIDLNSYSVVDSTQLSGRGDILFKKPASVTLNNRHYLITMGEYDIDVFYMLLRTDNGTLTVIRNDSIENATVEIFRQYAGEEGFRFGLSSLPGRNVILQTGLYGIGQGFNFRYLRNVNTGDEPGLIRNIGPYDYLIKVPLDTAYNLHYTSHNSQDWIIKLSENLTEALDSLPLWSAGHGNAVFAYHPGRNKFYCLHVNYELHYNEDGDTHWKSREDRYINPEVWIINPATLAIEQQLPIADYPEGNYPGEDGGLADVLGDYIVYYFFWGTGRARFDPAMLFIFDTRTNEATWLRVGWR